MNKIHPKPLKLPKQGFRGYFGHLLCLGSILVIYQFQGGILVIFQVQGVFLLTYKFKEHFCHFIGFEVFWSFFRFQGYFGHFKVQGLFWSYVGFMGTLVIFQISGGILDNFQVLYFEHFLGFEGISIIFRFLGYFSQFPCFGVILAIFKGSGVFWSFRLIFRL